MSSSGTWQSTTANRSGRWVSAAPTRRPPFDPPRIVSRVGRVNRRALALALLTGVFTACYSLVNKVGVSLVPVPLYAFLVFGVDAALIHLVRWVRGGLTLPLGRDAPWGRTVAVGVLMMAAYLAVLAAMAMAPVSYVVAAREVSIVVTAVLGVLVLRERHSATRIAGAAVIFAGLVVIALAR